MDLNYSKQYAAFERDHWWFAARRRVLNVLLAQAVPPGRHSVLDVGCGPGGSIALLSQHGRVTGVDFSPLMAGQARQRGYDGALASRAEAIGVRSQAFDVVVALDIVEHVDDEDAILRELFRVCARGGRLAVTVPAYQFLWGPQDVINHHRRRYTARHLADSIRRAGFTVERLTYFNTLLFPPIAAIRIVNRLWHRSQSAEVKSDFERARWRFTDTINETVFSLERFLLPFINFPFGVSLACIARKL